MIFSLLYLYRRVSLSRRQLKLDFAERMTALIGIETGERERELGAKRRTSVQETSESNARPRVLPERNAAFLPWNPCTRARTWTSRRFQVSMKTSNYPV